MKLLSNLFGGLQIDSSGEWIRISASTYFFLRAIITNETITSYLNLTILSILVFCGAKQVYF